MEINEIKELEEIEWKIMNQEVKITEEKIKTRRTNKIWHKNIKRRNRRRNKGVKKNAKTDKSRIRIIKELKQDFKIIESELELRKQILKKTRINGFSRIDYISFWSSNFENKK